LLVSTQYTNVTDTQTDGHRMTAQAALVCSLEKVADFLCYFCFILFFFNHCISVFMLLCFVFCCSIRNHYYHGRSARWVTPFWQPGYPLHVYFSRQINSAAAAMYDAHGEYHRANPYGDEDVVGQKSAEDVAFAVNLAGVELVEQSHERESREHHRVVLVPLRDVVVIVRVINVEQLLRFTYVHTRRSAVAERPRDAS